MGDKAYAITTTILFAMIAALHLVRLIWRWEVLVNGWPVPLWASGPAIVIAGYLAYGGFRLIKAKNSQIQKR